jgi:hypothetical protein
VYEIPENVRAKDTAAAAAGVCHLPKHVMFKIDT